MAQLLARQHSELTVALPSTAAVLSWSSNEVFSIAAGPQQQVPFICSSQHVTQLSGEGLDLRRICETQRLQAAMLTLLSAAVRPDSPISPVPEV